MEFEFKIGGYSATNYQVNYKKGILQCYTSDYAFPPFPDDYLTVKVITESNLENLKSFMLQCKWAKKYITEVCDGIQWELKVKQNGKTIKSYGSNAYPEDFNTFINLLNQVITASGIKIPTYDSA